MNKNPSQDDPFENEDELSYDDYVFDDERDDPDTVGLTSALDHEIIMHRDAHFGGQFSLMLEYYEGEGKGINPEFPLWRIQDLAEKEAEFGTNLAPLVLTGAEAERVASARNSYKTLRDLYDFEDGTISRMIADLILSEEEMPEKEIKRIVKAGPYVVPALIELVHSEEFADPLYPGYGFAPQLAAICLGQIGDPRAIIPLFELLEKESFFVEEDILSALRQIGEPSKAFIMKAVRARPLTEDNERAAMALSAFSQDPQVITLALEQLQDSNVLKKERLASFLLLACEDMQETKQKDQLKELLNNPQCPSAVAEEIRFLSRTWESSNIKKNQMTQESD